MALFGLGPAALEGPPRITILLCPLGLRPMRRRTALADGGLLLHGELLAWRGDQGSVNDLPAHGEEALIRQHLIEAAEQPFDGACLLELFAV
ncbi:hypothetical protein MON41_13835 [Roseomonas vastitatis]|uniref:Uncharacterized protein n=1 Tax=Teichococcus vastitatis TaxID=2307076 RepID=A0ABS9W6B4_9PROT|nr:hypothetical protein [Pseudoroseomonas vastitatis]MCI0754829.1 hypothetical protein [Pseudoroseomonas vastitatis]